MGYFANKIMHHMITNHSEWTEIEKMKMKLGFEVLLHNIFMIGSILIVAQLFGILTDSVFLMTAYGLLKINAGGIHLKKSSTCLLATGLFVFSGVMIAKQITLPLPAVILIYVVCILMLWKIGPQGTKNNPISPHKYKKLKRNAIVISVSYLLISIWLYVIKKDIPYLLLIALIFETISLLPLKLINDIE